jgi:hypothetical protein
MRTCFEEAKILEYWKSDLELEKWFDPAFEEFINKEIFLAIKKISEPKLGYGFTNGY